MRHLCLLLLGAGSLLAADAPSPAGDWHGTLKPGNVELRLKLTVQQSSTGELKATLYSLDQGGAPIPAASTTLEGSRLKLDFPSLKGGYDAQISGDGKTLSGTWSQMGNSAPLDMTRGPAPELVDTASATAAPLVGIWEGALDAGGTTLRVRLTLQKDEKGHIAGKLDSLDQNAMGMPATGISLEASAFHFDVKSVGGTYDGSVDEKLSTIKGTWRQGSAELPLQLNKVDKPK